MPYRLLALDIDGTLVNSQHQLTPATRDAIRAVKQAGVEVVLASGRRYSRVLPFVAELEIALPLVTASGALIKQASDHRTLYRASFDAGVLPPLFDIIAGYEPVLYGDTFSQGFDYYCRTLAVNVELAEFLEVNAGSERLYPTLLDDPPSDLFAGFVMGSQSQMLAIESELERQLGDALYVHVIRSPRYQGYMCEFAPVGIDKWFGVQQVARSLGISAEEICAVGDDVNDLPMITGAGLGIAMSNAVEPLKAAADRIAPCNNSDGLVEVVRWVLE
jgi:Cof subfamily protein (haloacid dehalogenase superfamily)